MLAPASTPYSNFYRCTITMDGLFSMNQPVCRQRFNCVLLLSYHHNHILQTDRSTLLKTKSVLSYIQLSATILYTSLLLSKIYFMPYHYNHNVKTKNKKLTTQQEAESHFYIIIPWCSTTHDYFHTIIII